MNYNPLSVTIDRLQFAIAYARRTSGWKVDSVNYRDRAHPRAFSGGPGSLCDFVDRFFWFLVVHIHHTRGSLVPHAKILPFALWRSKNISRRLEKTVKFQNTIGFIRKSFQIHFRIENPKILKTIKVNLRVRNSKIIISHLSKTELMFLTGF